MFQIPNILSAKKIKKIRDYYRFLLFDQEITKIEKKSDLLVYIYKIAIVNPIFLGRGIFTNLVGGHFAQASKKI